MNVLSASESWGAGQRSSGSYHSVTATVTPALVTGCDTTIDATLTAYHSNHSPGSGTLHNGAARLVKCSSITSTTTFHPTGEVIATTSTGAAAQTAIDSLLNDGGNPPAATSVPAPPGGGTIPNFYQLNSLGFMGEACVFDSGTVSPIDPSVSGGSILIGGTGFTVLRADYGSARNCTVNCIVSGGFHGAVEFRPVDARGHQIGGIPFTFTIAETTDDITTARPGFNPAEVIYTGITPATVNFDYNLKCRDAYYNNGTNHQIFGSGVPGGGVPAGGILGKRITLSIDNIFFGVTSGTPSVPAHTWDGGSGLVGHRVFTVSFPNTKNYAAITYSASGVGASVSGSTLTAGAALGTFTGSHATITHDPYRHLQFDWTKVGSGTLSVVVTVHQDNGAGTTFDKSWTVALTGTAGTCTIDELQGPGSTLIDGTRPSLLNKNRIDISRFGGIGQARQIKFAFTNEVLTVSTVRLAVTQETALQPFLSQTGSTWYLGRIDGREAFAVSAATVAGAETEFTNRGFTVSAQDYAMQSNVGLPPNTWNGVGGNALSYPFDSSFNFTPSAPPGDILVTATAGSFYVINGFAATGLFQTTLRCLAVLGTVCAATSVQGGRTKVRDIGFTTGSPVISRDFHTGLYGYGEDVIPGGVIQNTNFSERNEFTYVPANPPTQTKIAGNYAVALSDFNYCLIQEFLESADSLAYDVGRDTRHARAFAIGGDMQIGSMRNSAPFMWVDESVTKSTVIFAAVRWHDRKVLGELLVFYGLTTGTAKLAKTSDEGLTLTDMTTVTTNAAQGDFEPCGDLRTLFYWVPQTGSTTTIQGALYDSNEVLIKTFTTNITDCDNTKAIRCKESVGAGGTWRMGIQYSTTSGVLVFKTSDKEGVNFT